MGRRAVIAPAYIACVIWGCAGAPPPPSAEPAAERPPAAQAAAEAKDAPAAPARDAVETGTECAKAESACDLGSCTVTVDNGCDQPVTCALDVASTCKAGTTTLDAFAKKRGTIPAKSKGELAVGAGCTEGSVMFTRVKALSCK